MHEYKQTYIHTYIHTQLHDEWYGKHKEPPHSDAEKAEYKADMLRIVGKLDIDSKVRCMCV